MAKDRSKKRYDKLVLIGEGEYAKVYSAEDTKLGRNVAVKRVRSQFLDDQDKLSRYWKEAQLLVDVEHPNILTIYDLMKSKGCLVLELMKGNLKQIYGDRPMPVKDIREMLLQVARGLDCLHKNEITHGDVKPENLMLSRQDVVKLGDFGLARRASDEEGSLLKGTTKYMAPELVSEDFGEVGTASDLYSLGFSALELMIGPEFDSLFPDLIAFGRDKQMAWMMWHCSADRKFPAIQTVLEGVPDDLAEVLQKLTSKQQSERYKTAKELIDDLTGGTKLIGEAIRDDEAEANELAKKKKRKHRIQALVTCCLSLMVTGIIFWAIQEPRPKPVAKVIDPVRGIVKNVLPIDQKFVLELPDKKRSVEEYRLNSTDVVRINRKKRLLSDLQLSDRIIVHTRPRTETAPAFLEVFAFRPETHSGVLTLVDAENGKIIFSVLGGTDEGEVFELASIEETEISLNEESQKDGEPLTVSSLAEGDEVVVDLSDDESGMVALKVVATRLVSIEGLIRELDPPNGTITIGVDNGGGDEELITLPIDAACSITLNGLASIDEQLLSVSNVQVGDQVKIRHDIKIKTLDAYRDFGDLGRILSIDYAGNTIDVKSVDSTEKQQYKITPETFIKLGLESVKLTDLRPGDSFELSHDSPDEAIPPLISLDATRMPNRNRWVILIGNQGFDSSTVTENRTADADLESLRSILVERFAVPVNQVLVFENESSVRLRNEIPHLLDRLGSQDELYVYITTRGYLDNGDRAYLAAKEFVDTKMEDTGLALDWLIDQIDGSTANRKLLMLDCSTNESDKSVSGLSMVESIQASKRGGYPKSTYILSSSGEGERGLASTEKANRSLFGLSLADAFAGEADQQRDSDIETTELTTFVIEQVQKMASSSGRSQHPKLILPDDTPPRLSEPARQATIALLSKLAQKGLKEPEIRAEAIEAERLAGGQPDPMLACGILLIRVGKINEALEILESIRLSHSDFLVSHQAVIWIHFYKKHYKIGTAKIAELLTQIPKPKKAGESYSRENLDRLEWAGRLRELAELGNWAPTPRLPDRQDLANCDRLAADHGEVANARYLAGRKAAEAVVKQFQSELATDPDSKAKLERERIDFYVEKIASPNTVTIIRSGLDK
jgi:serine/threonine protein kinase